MTLPMTVMLTEEVKKRVRIVMSYRLRRGFLAREGSLHSEVDSLII